MQITKFLVDLKASAWMVLGLVMMIAVLPACWNKSENGPKKTGLFVLNVLEKSYYDDCHIAGSINVPFEILEQFARGLDKEHAEIVVYCANYACTASGAACKKLKSMGFKKVFAYEGGTAEWLQLGLPTEGPAQSSYLTKAYAKPEHTDPEVPVITAQELAAKLKLAQA